MKNETLTAILNEKDKLSAYMGVGVDYYKGETGKSGADEVYIGAEPPTDPQVKLWVDTEAQSVGAVDWNDVGNKPNFATVATSGSYNDLIDKPVIPEAPDLTPYAKTADLSTVATSGSYEDLTNKPTIPEPYTLPTASTTTLGGVKVDGSTITITDGIISSAGGGGAVSVDGTSIIQNEDGTISTALKTTSNSITGASLINLGTTNEITDYNGCIIRKSIIDGEGTFKNTKIIDNSIILGIGPSGDYGFNYNISVDHCFLMGYYVQCLNYGNNYNINYAFGLGNGLITRGNQFVIGSGNIRDEKEDSPTYSFIIGNGPDLITRSNALTVDKTGNLAIAGTMSSAGADYAEFFEWKDGNPEAEDRVGYIVSLDGDKLTLANEGDYILGVVSGTATVLGDNPEWNWAKRWVTDDFGRIQYEDKVIHHEAKDDIPAWDETIKAPVVNPDYNPDQKYIKRADRPEWSAVGMMGKLYVRDDGTCQVNGFAKPINGVATASTSGTMRVIERVSDNVIRVVIK